MKKLTWPFQKLAIFIKRVFWTSLRCVPDREGKIVDFGEPILPAEVFTKANVSYDKLIEKKVERDLFGFTSLRRGTTSGLGISILLIVVIACGEQKPSGDSTNMVDKIQRVEVVKPVRRSFQANISITGTAHPDQQVMLHAVESGYLRSIVKDIGEPVRKGEVIATLDNPTIDQMVSDAESEVAMGNASLTMADAQLQAAIAQAKATKLQADRLQLVADKTPQLTPIVEVEKAVAVAEGAQANVNVEKARKDAAESRVAALSQKLETAKIRKNQLVVRSPFKGIITQRFVDRGAIVQSGLTEDNAQPIVEIQKMDPLRLAISFPESDAPFVQIGTKARVTFPELPEGHFDVEISRISKALDHKSKTMRAEIDMVNPKLKIISGMYAQIDLEMENRSDLLSLPVSTQVMLQDQPHILLVNDGIVNEVPLAKGLNNEDFFEILNTQIGEESLIIYKGKNLVRDGQRVEVVIKSK